MSQCLTQINVPTVDNSLPACVPTGVDCTYVPTPDPWINPQPDLELGTYLQGIVDRLKVQNALIVQMQQEIQQLKAEVMI